MERGQPCPHCVVHVQRTGGQGCPRSHNNSWSSGGEGLDWLCCASPHCTRAPTRGGKGTSFPSRWKTTPSPAPTAITRRDRFCPICRAITLCLDGRSALLMCFRRLATKSPPANGASEPDRKSTLRRI